jgi:regulator of sirC expression with transglutaminase-like and TPR domain
MNGLGGTRAPETRTDVRMARRPANGLPATASVLTLARMPEPSSPLPALRFSAPTPLEYFAALVADDASLPLLEAAVAVAQDDIPKLDVQGVLAHIDTLCAKLRARLQANLPADAPPMPRVRLLNKYFFQELGFAGNVNHYYDRRNSLLPHVLQTRRGIPLTLALLYIEMANAIGLQAQGISFPGHFLVKLHMPAGEVVIDPFNGRSLGREDLEEWLTPVREQRGLVGDNDAPLGLFLQPAPARDVLARLLRNLKEIHDTANDGPRLVAVLRRLCILLPEAWEQQRDLALALHRLGEPAAAIQALSLYLQHRPQAEDAMRLRAELLKWQAQVTGDSPSEP